MLINLLRLLFLNVPISVCSDISRIMSVFHSGKLTLRARKNFNHHPCFACTNSDTKPMIHPLVSFFSLIFQLCNIFQHEPCLCPVIFFLQKILILSHLQILSQPTFELSLLVRLVFFSLVILLFDVVNLSNRPSCLYINFYFS